jgi:hypothetical protein
MAKMEIVALTRVVVAAVLREVFLKSQTKLSKTI